MTDRLNPAIRRSCRIALSVFPQVCVLVATVVTLQPFLVLQAQAPEAATSTGRPAYRIGPGDTLDIQVFGRPQLSRDAVRVDPRGRVKLPLITDELVAVCTTEYDLAAEIAKRYREYLVDPQVTVSVRDYASQPVIVSGAVWKPGTFQLQRPTHLRELLTTAGGLKPEAGMFAQLVHDEDTPTCDSAMDASLSFATETSVSAINLGALFRGEGTNPLVRPGDFINVPEAGQIFVVGHVAKPSALSIEQPLTVLRAIAMAGGRLPGSKSYARVIRQQPNSTGNQDFRVDLTAVERRGAADFELMAGDIVEVPVSHGKQMLKTVLTTVASAGIIYYPLLIIK